MDMKAVRSILLQKPKVAFAELDDTILLHACQFLGHVGSLQIQIIGKLLSVKRNVKFR